MSAGGMRRLLPMTAAFFTLMASAAFVERVSCEQDLWSTARLSVARSDLAAASVGNVALFAGGSNTSAYVVWQ